MLFLELTAGLLTTANSQTFKKGYVIQGSQEWSILSMLETCLTQWMMLKVSLLSAPLAPIETLILPAPPPFLANSSRLLSLSKSSTLTSKGHCFRHHSTVIYSELLTSVCNFHSHLSVKTWLLQQLFMSVSTVCHIWDAFQHPFW